MDIIRNAVRCCDDVMFQYAKRERDELYGAAFQILLYPMLLVFAHLVGV